MAVTPIANLAGSSQMAGTKVPLHVLTVDSAGNAVLDGLGIPRWDRIDYTATSSTVDTYVYSLSAVTVATIVIAFTDTTKTQPLIVTRTLA